VVYSSSTILTEIVWEINGPETVENSFFQIRVMTFLRLCRPVSLWTFEGYSVPSVRGSADSCDTQKRLSQ
jgi:hypothetical protein